MLLFQDLHARLFRTDPELAEQMARNRQQQHFGAAGNNCPPPQAARKAAQGPSALVHTSFVQEVHDFTHRVRLADGIGR
jgi:hypothetical protein